MTRLGDNSRIIFSGDFRQSDLRNSEKDDIHKLLRVSKVMKSFEFVEMQVEDIVRGGRVKDFIIKSTELGYSMA